MSSALSLALVLMTSVLGALAVGSGMLAIISFYQERKGQQALAVAIEPYVDDIPQTVPKTLADRIVVQLEKWESGRNLLQLMDQAEIGIAPGRLILAVVVWAGVGLFAGILLLHNLLFGLLLAATMIGVGLFLVGRRAQRRWQRLAEQLPEALTIISNALIAGSGVLQAFERAARELSAPINPELERVVQDVKVGLDLEEALQNLQQRVPVAELEMVVSSILIQRRSGGNLAELLAETATLLREEIRLNRELRVLTSQARLSGQIVGVLPLAFFMLFYFTSPDYLSPLLTTTLGKLLLTLALLSEVAGFLIIQKMVSIPT